MLKRTTVLAVLLFLTMLAAPALADQAPAGDVAQADEEISQGCHVVETASASTEADPSDPETALFPPETSLSTEEAAPVAMSEMQGQSADGLARWYGPVHQFSFGTKLCDNCCVYPDSAGCCNCCSNKSCTVTLKVCCP